MTVVLDWEFHAHSITAAQHIRDSPDVCRAADCLAVLMEEHLVQHACTTISAASFKITHTSTSCCRVLHSAGNVPVIMLPDKSLQSKHKQHHDFQFNVVSGNMDVDCTV